MSADADDYESVPYEGYVIPGLCPEHLLRTSWAHGGPRPRLDGCRVLEIGCGDGVNLLPLAFHARSSTFVGFDRSEPHVERARRSASELGLSNLELRVADVRSVGVAEIGDEPFDYVLCHGVLSWVPEVVGDAILALCRRVLAPNGLACVSYNALPGWSVRGLVRDVLMRAVDPHTSPLARAQQAKARASEMASLAPESHPYGALFARELRIVIECRDSYLVHEYLAPDNHAYWLRDFVTRAESHGLSYVAEASFNRPDLQPPTETVSALSALGLTARALDETLDALLYRQFRSSVLTRSDVPHEPREAHEMLADAEIALALRASGDPFQLEDGAYETFGGQHGFELDTSDSALKAALLLLSSLWPDGLDLATLRERVVSMVERNGLPAPCSSALDDLGPCAIELFRGGQAELRLTRLAPSREVSVCPCAHTLARHEARVRDSVTSRNHVSLPLDDLGRAMVAALDGTRRMGEVVEIVARAHAGIERAELEGRVGATMEVLTRWGIVE